jgi:hypothetical protein
MKGRNRFNKTETEELKRLIKAKESATPDKQKGIRNIIRKIGFYYSDFRSQKVGYTLYDFEVLIKSGEITISENSENPTSKTLKFKSNDLPPKNQNDSDTKTSNYLNSIFTIFKKNRFDPTNCSQKDIPNYAGNYLICIKKGSCLPTKSFNPFIKEFDGLPIIYTGIASKSMRERDFRQHFTGNNAGRSTLRKSIGVLFGYKQVPRDKNPLSKKTKFTISDELELSQWMRNNLVMYCFPSLDYNNYEKLLIQHFNPPLNLKDNHNSINLDFRQNLKRLRNNK